MDLSTERKEIGATLHPVTEVRSGHQSYVASSEPCMGVLFAKGHEHGLRSIDYNMYCSKLNPHRGRLRTTAYFILKSPLHSELKNEEAITLPLRY